MPSNPVISRGDLFLAELNPSRGSEQAGVRPVVVVSRDAIHRRSSVIVCVPLTDRARVKAPYPTHCVLSTSEGLKKESIALCEQVRAISSDRLMQRLGRLSSEAMRSIDVRLRIALDLD